MAVLTFAASSRIGIKGRQAKFGDPVPERFHRRIAKGVQTLLLFDPTRGIDIRTKRQIYTLVRDLADQGAAVLFYTSELAEIRLACDRAVVIFNGRVVDVIDAKDADEPTLMRAAYGLTEKAPA